MEIVALGHAGLQINGSAGTVLIDPWFSPEGAFLGSWFPFPDNATLIDTLPRDPAAVVITHEHLDHVDPWILSKLSPEVPLVIPRYPASELKRKLALAGRHPIIELDAWQRQALAEGFDAFVVPEASPMNHDAGVVIIADGHSLVNLNDARLFPVQLRRIRSEVGGHVDALTAQGAGASWYPVVYDYDDARMAELRAAKRRAKLGYLASTIEILDPSVALPFAGPPCFLDDSLRHLNSEIDHGIFPTQREVAAWLEAERGLETTILLPGDRWDTERVRKIENPAWVGFWDHDFDEYIDAYARRRKPNLEAVHARYPAPVESLDQSVRDYFEHLLSMSEYFNEQIDMRVGFDITGPGGGAWTVDFRSASRAVTAGVADVNYLYRFESKWLPPILNGTVPWEDFFLSMRFYVTRKPDLYNDHLLGLLKFADARALTAVEEAERGLDLETMMTVECDGTNYTISRYCPHAGNDLLETGETLRGGIIRCLAHHYDFDLTTGECINGRSKPLVIGAVDSQQDTERPEANAVESVD